MEVWWVLPSFFCYRWRTRSWHQCWCPSPRPPPPTTPTLLSLQPLLGSAQPAMSAHSPPLALPFDLSVCMAALFLFSLSLGLSRSITRRSPAGEHRQLLLPILDAVAAATPSVKLMHTHKMDMEGDEACTGMEEVWDAFIARTWNMTKVFRHVGG